MKSKYLNKNFLTISTTILIFLLLILSNDELCFSYQFQDPIPNTNYLNNINNNYHHKTYPEEDCSPHEISIQTIKLDYSLRTKIKNEFKVGWNYYSSLEIPAFLKPTIGGEVQIMRCLPPGKWVFLGKGNVEKINGNSVEALISGYDEKHVSSGKIPQNFVETRNMFWRPMAGDSVFPIQKNISKKIIISPKFELATHDIFTSLELNKYSFEISSQGEELLKEKFSYFKNFNGRLLVEGFILSSNNREELRIESLMRAQAVAKYLQDIFNLDEDKIIAIGYGNDWLKTGMQPVKSWPQKNISSGIVLRLMPNDLLQN